MPQRMFETARLIVRQISAADIDAMFAVYSDAEAMRWVGEGDPLDRAGCVRWVEVTERNYATRGYGMSALIDKVTGEVIGFCGLVHPDQQPEPEIKYALLRERWGKGLATEAAQGMLAYGHQTLHLPLIIATVHPDNHASQKVLLKSGMNPEEPRINDDGTMDLVFSSHP